MVRFSIHIFMFIVPGIIGNVMHMIIVKKNMFAILAKPVSVKLFGENKTYRGFIFLPVAMGLVCITESLLIGPFSTGYLRDLFIGMGLGFVYMLSELPNSFIKRRLNIASGASSAKHRLFQLIADKTDSLTGACVFYYFMIRIQVLGIVLLFIISLLLHFAISCLLVLTNLKKSI